MPNNYIYLHGFASSPQSQKAQYLHNCFQKYQINLTIPDLNQGDFSQLTLTRQIQQVASLLTTSNQPVTLIGSSFGGLTAAWLAQQYPQVERLILIAPAFNFLEHWLPKFTSEQLNQWKTKGYLAIYHHQKQDFSPLHYQFLTDALQYQETNLSRALPTLIVHGINDEVIPLQSSFSYATARPWVNLIELDSDHGLTDMMLEIWQAIEEFEEFSSD